MKNDYAFTLRLTSGERFHESWPEARRASGIALRADFANEDRKKGSESSVRLVGRIELC